ncbi:hypothetical protein N9934_03235, partial [Desulfosarcina sp.]|nr:hypothetical protein [Desulfosarcina sp.]
MNIYVKLVVACITQLSLIPSHAYEINTHDQLSQKTALCSVLSQESFIENIGWVSIQSRDKDALFYREDIINKKNNILEHTTQNLIGWGAAYEDEETKLRPVNHFFNPLTSGGGSAGLASPDWVLEDLGKILIPKEQKYSFSDANKMILDALTTTDKNERKEHWGQFFQTLGMVIHHIQDMSQPQHVRNDNHCDGDIDGVSCYGFHNPSYYEEYTNENRSYILRNFDCSSYQQLDLRYFSTARDFWLTDNGNGRGMAEFTNRNFVSAGTNFRKNWFTNQTRAHYNFPDPDPNNAGAGEKIHKVDIQDPTLMSSAFPLPGEIWFYETRVSDNYLGTSEVNERSSTASLWNDKFEKYNIYSTSEDEDIIKRSFNLNKFNFQAAYPFLIPRAIAYGAGLINYFFRGRLDVRNVLYLSENELIFTIKNITGKKNPGNAPFNFSEGSFSLYFDDSNGIRHALTDRASTPGSLDLVGGEMFADEDE